MLPENLNSLKVVQLKDELRARNLKVSGRKAQLIERLEQYLETSEQDSSSNLHPNSSFCEPIDCVLDLRTRRYSRRIQTRNMQPQVTKDRMSTSSALAMKKMLNNNKVDINDPQHRILVKCSDPDVVTLSSLFPAHSKVKKLGEGVYAEVYSHNGNAVKVMPVNGKIRINDAEQKTLEGILGEIAITKILSELSVGNLPYYYTDTFVKLSKVNIARGKYPKILDDAWVDYDENVKESENDRPSTLLKTDQMYIVLQLTNGGVALEDYEGIKNVEIAMSIFNQSAFGMAVAESRYQFEHRDLHVGNLLIKEVVNNVSRFEIRGQKLNVDMKGVQVTIIDFTLSRATHMDEFTNQPLALYTNLDLDRDLFKGRGDIQFDIYREMDKIIPDYPNRWRTFFEKTNILWLSYLHQKILEKLPKRCKGRKLFVDLGEMVKNMKSCVEYYNFEMDNRGM